MSATARLIFAAIACCMVAACEHAPSQHGSSDPTTRAASTRPYRLAFAAMSYYDQSCANCHGPAGAFYGPTLGNDLTDAGLIQKCLAMSAGPGNAPTTDEENLVVTAYHRSLIMRTPYVAVTEITGSQWTGEATTGAKIALQLKGQSIPAKITDWNWTVTLPADTAYADVTIQASLNGTATTLKLSDGSYSNTTPLPPPDRRHK